MPGDKSKSYLKKQVDRNHIWKGKWWNYLHFCEAKSKSYWL